MWLIVLARRLHRLFRFVVDGGDGQSLTSPRTVVSPARRVLINPLCKSISALLQKRPKCCGAAIDVMCQEKTNASQQSASYSITSSATVSSAGGMVRLSTLAVLRFMASSNLTGC